MLSYQCPSCGGELIYVKQTDDMICTSCNSHFSLLDIEPKDTGESQLCISCGSPIDSHGNILSGFCEACERSVIHTDVLDSMQTPDFIAPFEFDDKEAEKKFKAWLKTRPLVSNELRKSIHITKTNKYLMPFWCFDYENSGSMLFDVTTTTKHSSGDYIITEIKHFDAEVIGNVITNYIPADGMEELDDDYMEAITPFNNDNITNFDPCVLSGTRSKRYDYDNRQVKHVADTINERFVVDYFSQRIQGYKVANIKADAVIKRNNQINLIYYPLYIFSCNVDGKTYKFYMNGQSGCIAGETPISPTKVFRTVAIATLCYIPVGYIYYLCAGFAIDWKSALCLAVFSIIAVVIYYLYYKPFRSKSKDPGGAKKS
jgi:hypothetical protein